ncbi:AAA family ATPase [Paenibacillus spiritus]|uniref:AAA family ATPase n=1 Tax=Paenibacillus spiritus TaxID=2496557 RepID=A0A5J5G2Y0_9BACL|nr:AAA family ATPase [Paenibacillus spiritus]KAA9001003.1 AAA family ATPase [Paenibacillus spiritus]
MGRTRQMIGSALKFLLPEVQLVQTVREHGWVARREPAAGREPEERNEAPEQAAGRRQGQERMRAAGAGAGQTAAQTAPQGAPQPVRADGRTFGQAGFPASAAPVPEPGKTGQEDWSVEDLDRLFQEAEAAVNRRVVGQRPFVADLVAAYRQGYMNESPDQPRSVILVAGPPGTGKRTALNELLRSLHVHKRVPAAEAAELDLSHYTEQDLSGNFIEDLAAAFRQGEGTVLFGGLRQADSAVVAQAARLAAEGRLRTREGIRISAAGSFIVFYLDDPGAERGERGRIPAGLSGRLPSAVLQSVRAAAVSEPHDPASMQEISRALLEQAAEKLSRNTDTAVEVDGSVPARLARLAAEDRTFGEAVQEWIDRVWFPALSELRARGEIRRGDRVRLVFSGEEFRVEAPSGSYPVRPVSLAPDETLEEAIAELNGLIGLEPVKTCIRELMDTAALNRRRAAEGAGAVPMALHMVFTGNPGTGKTTVARLVGRILKAMGLLERGQLVEAARQDLVGSYVGSTAPKTMAKVEEATGGVLFIDEAYTLARHDHDTFGLEAIDTLVKAMEDRRDRLVVIIAGYTQETEGFLESNPGLRSRFPFMVEFPDYAPGDLLRILEGMAAANGLRLDDQAREGLAEQLERAQIPGRKDGGNGRLARNLLEEAVRRQAVRLREAGDAAPEELGLLTAADFGLGEQPVFDLDQEMNGIVGLAPVKSFIRALEQQVLADRRRRDAGIEVRSEQTLNMIFTGNPGTGKTTIARLTAGMLRSLGVLKKGHLVEVGRSDLVAEYVGHTAVQTKRVVESALGGVLFIDEAYALAQDGVQGGGFGREAIDTLVRLIELHKDNLVVIMAGYTEDMERFVSLNPGMASRFPLRIEFPDYTAGEMRQIAETMVRQRGFRLAPDMEGRLEDLFRSGPISARKDAGNGRLVRNVLEEAIRRQAGRLAEQPELEGERLNELNAADFGWEGTSRTGASEGDALRELDAVVGLEPVKAFVRSLSAQIEVGRRRRELGLPQAAAQTLHMVFQGNPGTGKTTIARILARRLRELGVIQADTLVETDRSGLVAGYVGQTALKTREVIERALGGVLFVDEAYALAEGDSFGQEAIDTLVKAMDDYRDKLIVILAGYEADMERFMNRNAGLRSRFPNVITFPDYSAEEMLLIARGQLAAQGYAMTAETELRLLDRFNASGSERESGNGRLVRNLAEQALRAHALRVSRKTDATAEELSTLLPEDIPGQERGISG